MAKAYLASDCNSSETPRAIASAVGERGATPDWQLSLDATSLQAGHHYSLCWEQYEVCGPTMAAAMAQADSYDGNLSNVPWILRAFKSGLDSGDLGVLLATESTAGRPKTSFSNAEVVLRGVCGG